jgi:erythromycin esterase
VLLGEASHGTHEYYTLRAEITRRLVSEKDFAFVAVEGDWPDCDAVDRTVRHADGAPCDVRTALQAFERWPTWMWANEEVLELATWLRGWNAARAPEDRVGFHGLDVYSLWDSLREILRYLERHDSAALEQAVAAVRCFEPYGQDPQQYAWASRLAPETCEDELTEILATLRARAAADGQAAFVARQNAEVAAGAERYYRAMVRGGPESWNLRDTHMVDTLDRLLEHYGPRAKGLVWAHNTHVGDARYTDMADGGLVNVGQLVRERHGEDDVVIVGFGGGPGNVVAGRRWGAAHEVMPVPAPRVGSLESVLTEAGVTSGLFVHPRRTQPEWLTDFLGHRAIGVVYDPGRERHRNYVPTRLGRRYDAFCFLGATSALRPLGVPARGGELETLPSGV